MIEDFLHFNFLRYTLYTGLLIGIIAPMLGSFLVVRHLSLLADALSHVTLAGITFGLFLEKQILPFLLSPFYSGVSFSILGAILIEKLRSVYKGFEEIGIPIVLSSGIGLSVIFISLADGFNHNLFDYLFGSVSAVTKNDLLVILIISFIVLCLVLLFFKELVTISFDENHAIVLGLHTKMIHFIFIVLTALVIAASMRIVGILLVSALMTLPVASAVYIAKGFKQMLILSIIIGEFSIITGLISGYHLNVPPGGTIVVILIMILLLSFLVKRIFSTKKRRFI